MSMHKHVYLAGAIEYAPDEGQAWRREVSQFLTGELKMSVFDPAHRERTLLSDEEKRCFRKWKSQDRERFLPVIRRLIDADLSQILEQTSFIVVYWDQYSVQGTGTSGELTLAYLHDIPVYMVLGIPVEQTSSWVLGCATEVFVSFDQLKNFLSELYLCAQ